MAIEFEGIRPVNNVTESVDFKDRVVYVREFKNGEPAEMSGWIIPKGKDIMAAAAKIADVAEAINKQR